MHFLKLRGVHHHPLPYFYLFFHVYLPSSNLGLTPPGTYNPNARGSDACRGEQQFGDQNTWHTRAGLPECMVSTMSGPPPKTTQDRTHTESQAEMKIPDPAGNQTRVARLEGRDSTKTPWQQILFLFTR